MGGMRSRDQDQTGLVGAANAPNDSGLVGTPTSPENSGLVGGSETIQTDESVTDDATYGSDSGYPGAYGGGTGGPGLSGQPRTPESEPAHSGYDPPAGNAGRGQDRNAPGQPGTPDYEPDYPHGSDQPIPSGYSGAPNSPGIPDQVGTQDQTIYTDQSGATPSQNSDTSGELPGQSAL